MAEDSKFMAGDRRFPTTHLSVFEALRQDDKSARTVAFDLLVAAYWRPAYTHFRARWAKERTEAEDLTQEFFARAFEKDFFAPYDPRVARFRTFIRTCLDRFAAKEKRHGEAIRRGGDVSIIRVDFSSAEADYQTKSSADAPDAVFDREWIRSVFELAVERLREESNNGNRAVPFELFRKYDLEEDESGKRPTYADLATEYQIKETDVTNYLAAMRRRFRSLTLEILRSLTGSEEEFREEAKTLLGVDLP